MEETLNNRRTCAETDSSKIQAAQQERSSKCHHLDSKTNQDEKNKQAPNDKDTQAKRKTNHSKNQGQRKQNLKKK